MVRNLNNRNTGYVIVHCDALNQHFLHFANLLDFGARYITVDARANFQFHRIFFSHLNRTVVQNVGTAGCQLQHFIIGDLIQLVCMRYDARVGGINTINVGVDLALVSFHSCSDCYRTCIASAASECGDIVVAVDSLESCNNDDIFLVQLVLQTLGVDLLDTGILMGGFG